MRRLLTLVVLLSLAAATLPPQVAVRAEDLPQDYDVPNGHFFPSAADGAGFLIANQAGVPLYREYQRLGGVDWFGPATSRRWQWGDRLVQMTRASLLMWTPDQRAVTVGNVLDVLHDAGQDEFLTKQYLVPPPLPADFDAGKSPDQVAQARRALLDTTPGIRRLYNSAADPMTRFGLPTSRPLDNGPFISVRFQKVVAQEWQDTGVVTLMDLSAVLAAANWIPADALKVEAPLRLAGQGDRVPWSGWWWPASAGSGGPHLYDQGGPLDKFDTFVIALGQGNPQTRQWEFERNRLTAGGFGWAGHCNGWAAASILEPEPTQAINRLGVDFSVADQKGILTAYHFADSPLWAVGTETGNLGPASFHRAIVQWLGGNHKSMVATFFNGPEENWSYPVYRFQTLMGPDPVDPDVTIVQTTLWFATFDVPANFVGTQVWPGPQGKTFTYTLNGPREEPTGGAWTGDSVGGLYGHPGRLWYPDPATRNTPDPVTSPSMTSEFLRVLFKG